MSESRGTSELILDHDITTPRILSMIVAVLMGLMSLVGLILPEWIYPSEDLIQNFVPNDVINLFIGLPILLGSMWLTQRGSLVGLLLWPGAVLYVLYNYIVYVVGISLGWITFPFLALVLLSAYTVFDLVRNINERSVHEQLAGKVLENVVGWILIAFGILFLFRAVSMIVAAGTNRAALPILEIGVLVADIVLSVLMIAGGAALLRRMPLGYISGLGLLFAASMLFVGLIVFLLLQPLITEAPFALLDVIVVFVMGLICFIPFGLFVRGVASEES